MGIAGFPGEFSQNDELQLLKIPDISGNGSSVANERQTKIIK